MWDIHNHILPGLDDGASCLEETMAMIDEEYEQGIRNIVCTPHYRVDMFEIGKDDRIEIFQKVQEFVKKAHPDMKLYLGCELHMHPEPEEILEDQIYYMPGDKVLLTEFSGGDNFRRIKRILKPLLREGYRCIVAHVERYQLDKEDIRKLHEMDGVYIQVNADPIIGKDGFLKKHFVWSLLKDNLVDFIGSDGHNTDNRAIHMGKCIEKIQKKLGTKRAEVIFRENPEKIFHI